ncbi:FKBP-type peptidyl-prolyl cis-trans isomerase SlyD [Mariprofundus micogutta]|uniref:Peptidyl-prolyl cis-trans isomerase n=1 Tax=Mariprofundus micogutta TaxID=1921010 RepID=A0A1L8CNA2_9PROT|nr:peptidylprolyl isomerase [Mariprofundus micogutta]GAV20396.1 FKBP-type peptidyl-prolyl cis-trans isomerase SlyD [Mariprofundus micogutta]
MQISNHKVVSFQYTLTNAAGDIIDSSVGGDALVYLHGEENIIPGLELALEGKSVGDKLKVSLEAADAYGEIDPAMVEVVSREVFEGIDSLEVGMEFETATDDGNDIQFVRISDIDGDNITVDGNHPLAGKNLNFDVEIEDIRDATAEELEHGHVHGGEACCGAGDCCS